MTIALEPPFPRTWIVPDRGNPAPATDRVVAPEAVAPEAQAQPLNRLVARRPSLSVIVPTRNESGNIRPLLDRLHQVLGSNQLEVIFVDDSSDETPEVIRGLLAEFPFAVRLIARPAERRNGLGMAVVEGFQAARFQWVCVMDGDLQHPPEVIPDLIQHAFESGSDLVAASRLAPGGSAAGLSSVFRLAVSKALAGVCRVLFPYRLRSLSDPMTGFFVARRDLIDPTVLKPRGFKILLEVIMRCAHLRISEIPFEFGRRHAGESKADLGNLLALARQLIILRAHPHGRLAQFLAVGASGVVVNSALMALFTELFAVHYLISAAVATQGSSLWNFGWTEAWVYPDRRRAGKGMGARLAGYVAINNLLLVLRTPLLALLVVSTGAHYLVANVMSLAMIAAARFLVADRFLWRKRSEVRAERGYFYDIHGIIKVRSMGRLPELERFRTEEGFEQADIDVRIEKDPAAFRRADSICFQESPGRLGFSIVLNRDEKKTEVIVSRMVGGSPHVLYTNVVEPLLRWLFVRKGYALMHGACLSFDGRAVFITARTDTGKTSTILQTIRRDPGAVRFLSDDMTIFRPDGEVLSYPKPLTVSKHTLQAVGGAPLSLRERLFLQVQSRLHSRGGRRAGLLLSRSSVPAATLNAIVQWLIPPPKYMVDRLIVETNYADRATLDRVVVIERGDPDERPVPPGEVVPTLLANAEDAYGFPPYPILADALSHWQGQDLHEAERKIVEKALRSVPAVHIHRDRFDWHERIAELVRRPTEPPKTAIRMPNARRSSVDLAIGSA